MMIRTMWKYLLLFLLVFINFFPSLVSAKDVIYSKEVTVLVYHHIDDHLQGGVTITTELFKTQLEALNRNGFRFITMDQFKNFMTKGADIPDNAVLITFDDGYRSFYTNAYPILKKMHIPAVNFVITKDLENPQGSQLPSLSREDIVRMRKENPNIDFQSHSDQMHVQKDGKPMLNNKFMINGSMETDDQLKLRVISDTKKSMAKLIELNGAKSVDAYAYPFGSYDDQTIDFLHEAGIKYGFTTKTGIASLKSDPMQIPRINAGSPYVQAQSINNLIKQAKRHQLQSLK
ncbi:polysaccharide deacetylase family protein [Paenibacillus sp. N3.4]|uniref:polysaccharide deacetylase family protein n=1 Tax=Paenibacillus sp. N3.4 TaxID=2603222 RepID=UPI0011CC9B0D|nr:polysaccharide deacetylase family protein [Paenibacillus sp. N3.4]TXK81395.1 polysaccharide deacetylase family protein [Paenibacillus sp. N3.4]